MMSNRNLTALFVPLCESGHVNPSIGLATEMKTRGYRIVFATEKQFEGKFNVHGFEEIIYARPQEVDEQMDEWLEENKQHFKEKPYENYYFLKSVFDDLTKIIKSTNNQIKDILDFVKPDIVFESHWISYPCLQTNQIPRVWICCPNPLYIPCGKDLVPQALAGLPTTDPSKWEAFSKLKEKTLIKDWKDFNEWFISEGGQPLQKLVFIKPSSHLNVYVYPEELDYTDLRPLDSTYIRLDSSIRKEVQDFVIPEKLTNIPGKLIYFSMGTIGSRDVKLMTRLTNMMAKSTNKFIVSKGINHEEYALPSNMWGDKFLPQNKILPIVDMFITHGGNNSLTEALYYGRPMIVLPIFGDQHDNGVRVQEKKLGYTFHAYSVNEEELIDAIETVLADQQLKYRLQKISQRIQNSTSIRDAVDCINRIIKISKE